MSQSKNEIIASDSKSFNQEYINEAVKGWVVGPTSTALTFFADKNVINAMKLVATGKAPHNSNLYAQAFHESCKYPIKGLPVALLNSGLKNSVFFPVKHVSAKYVGDELSGFLAGPVTNFIMSPMSLIKARLMSNGAIVGDASMTLAGLWRGYAAISIRDSLQYGVYFLSKDFFKKILGDNVFSAGVAGIAGYFVSNPINVIGMNQKISLEAINIPNMAKKIYKTSGVSGFYPVKGLSFLRMFTQGATIDAGMKIHKYLTEGIKNKEKPEENSSAAKPSKM